MMRNENEDSLSVADDNENFMERQVQKSSKKGTLVMCCLSFFLGITVMIASVYVLSTDVPPFHEQMQISDVVTHLESLQHIANELKGRSPITGYNASIEYFHQILEEHANYFTLTIQYFPLRLFRLASIPTLSYEEEKKEIFFDKKYHEVLKYSGSGNVTGPVVLVNNLGCNDTDFPTKGEGKVALVWRGGCNFDIKAINAQGNGYSALLIVNDRPGSFTGTLGAKEVFILPVVGVSDEIGEEIKQFADDNTFVIRVLVDAEITESVSSNLIAETKDGDEENVIVVGAHLDSMEGTSGINDNGSGSSAIMALALKLVQRKVKLRNKLIFGWWGAEEDGLIGSEYFIDSLYEEEKIQKVKANINVDMMGSPNYIRGIYNASAASEEVREKSIRIQTLFEQFFKEHEMDFELTPFNKRSDYASFVNEGIPAGGLFAGSDGVKTLEQRKKFGGIIGAPYDPCYHKDCDTIENVNEDVLIEMTKALAFAVYEMATVSNLEEFLTRDITEP